MSKGEKTNVNFKHYNISLGTKILTNYVILFQICEHVLEYLVVNHAMGFFLELSHSYKVKVTFGNYDPKSQYYYKINGDSPHIKSHLGIVALIIMDL